MRGREREGVYNNVVAQAERKKRFFFEKIVEKFKALFVCLVSFFLVVYRTTNMRLCWLRINTSLYNWIKNCVEDKYCIFFNLLARISQDYRSVARSSNYLLIAREAAPRANKTRHIWNWWIYKWVRTARAIWYIVEGSGSDILKIDSRHSPIRDQFQSQWQSIREFKTVSPPIRILMHRAGKNNTSEKFKNFHLSRKVQEYVACENKARAYVLIFKWLVEFFKNLINDELFVETRAHPRRSKVFFYIPKRESCGIIYIYKINVHRSVKGAIFKRALRQYILWNKKKKKKKNFRCELIV